MRAIVFLAAALLWASSAAGAQTLAGLQGRVFDASGAVLAGAVIRVQNASIGFEASVSSDGEGRYYADQQTLDKLRLHIDFLVATAIPPN